MLVLVLERAPAKMVGYCSSWALQVATGVYVANLPTNQREEIWRQLTAWANPSTRVVMIWDTGATEQGLAHRTLGFPRRAITEREGLLISTWLPRSTDESPDHENSP